MPQAEESRRKRDLAEGKKKPSLAWVLMAAARAEFFKLLQG
jgi:hypothetical protein